MNITPLGFVVIPIGLLLFIKGPKYLMWAVVASAPFIHTRIILLPFWTTGIWPVFYFGSLLLLRKSLDAAVTGDVRISLPFRGAKWLLIFLFVVGLSLAMPVLLEGQVHVLPIETFLDKAVRTGFESSLEPLRLGRINFTQALYPFFMVFLFFGITSEIKTPEQLHRILKLNVALAVLVVLSGIFYQLASILKQTEILNSLYFFMMGWPAIPKRYFSGSAGIPRIYSFAGEPGHTGAFLLFALGQTAVPIIMNRTDLLWGKFISVAIFAFLFLGLLMTGATTGYVGIPIFLGSLIFFPNLRSGIKKISSSRILVRFFVTSALLFVLLHLLFSYYIKIDLWNYIYQTHINKLLAKSGSGTLRIVAVIHALKIFIRYPLLGVGIGSNQAASLPLSLLSNVGLAGAIPFLFFNWIVFRKGMAVYRKTKSSSLAIIALALTVSFVPLFGVMLLQSLTLFTFSYYWLLLAMIAAAYRFYKMETNLWQFR